MAVSFGIFAVEMSQAGMICLGCFPSIVVVHNIHMNSSRMTAAAEHYVQGGLDYQFVEKTLDQRLECSICLLALRNPHQTSCGHRFCYSCILAWLNEGKSCPHDNASLGEGKKGKDMQWCKKKLPLYGVGVQSLLVCQIKFGNSSGA